MSDTTCKIAADILYDCANPPLASSKSRALILPRRGVKTWAVNSSNPMIVESITRKDDGSVYEVRAYEYVTDKPLKPTYEMQIGDFGVTYRQTLPIHLKSLTPAIRYEIYKLAKEGDGVIVLLEQNFKGTAALPNAKWLVLGLNVGLFVAEDLDDANRNIAALLLATKDEQGEPFSAQHFYITSESATDAAIEALLTTTIPTP
jgi:hypothetical protein